MREGSSKRKMEALFDCIGCSENYSEDRIPRLLSCGHSLCTACVEKFTEDQSSCAECNKKERVKSIDRYAINYPLLKRVRLPPKKDVYVSRDSMGMFSKVFNNSEHKDSWSCEGHSNPICLFCCSCNAWMCQDCLVMDHPVLPRGSCKVIEFVDALKKIKCKFDEAVEETSKDIDSIKENFDFGMSSHDFCLKHCTNERSHLRIINRVEELSEGERENNDSAVEDARKRLKELTDSEVTTSPEKLTSTIQELMTFKEELKDIIREEEDRLSKITPPMNKHLRLELKRLAWSTKPLYAIANESENPMFARIVVKDQRLLVYSLQEGKPTGDCITVPYGFVKKLIPDSDCTVFFEIGTAEELFGRVYVITPYNMNHFLYLKQLLLMCTAEKGVSYKDTNFFKYDESGLLHGGDYEKNDGTGGKNLIEGLSNTHLGCVCESFSKRGVLITSQVSTRFTFHLEHQRQDFLEGYLGKVYDGLGILKTVSKLEPVTKAVIMDCGVVIPVELKYPTEESKCMDPADYIDPFLEPDEDEEYFD